MTVRVNKSAFNLREKLSELERPIGVKGNELMGAETAQDARDLVSAGRKNALYNGDMQIWQRGTVFGNGGGGGTVNYTADRWNSTRYASSENDVSREDANYLGFRYCLRSARGGGDTTTTARFVSQVLEQKDTWKLRGKYVTFSFYLRVGSGFNGGLVKSSITYHTDSSREERFYYNQFVNGNNTQSRIEHESLSTDWQRFTHTTYIPDNAQQVGVAIESNESLLNSVSADYFEMTGCQLEVGRNATEFEHRPYGEEFALCQRYCQSFDGRIAIGNWTGATGALVVRHLSPPMRIAPSIHSYTAGRCLVEAVAWYTVGNVTIQSETRNTSVAFQLNSVANSGQSVNANAMWGNGASVVLQAEL
jgi:hypothetical protein